MIIYHFNYYYRQYALYIFRPPKQKGMEAEPIEPTQTQARETSSFSMFQNEHYENLLVRSVSGELDDFLEGGLHKGVVTQLYGEAGCGKTQLAMMFVLGAISRRMPACYLATEKQLSWNRFASLAYNFMNEAEFEENQKMLMYKKTSDFGQGYSFIEESMKKIKDNKAGGLLVIDSVHCFVMSCLENNSIENDAFQKSKKQAEIVNRIRWLAKMAGVAVLFLNHAADVIDRRRGSSGRSVVPALGHAWELNIDENLYLTRKAEIRELSVVHSPKCPLTRKKRFRIESAGFTWISQDGVEYVE